MLNDIANLVEDACRTFAPASLICLLSIVLLMAPTRCAAQAAAAQHQDGQQQQQQQQQQVMATVADLPIYRLHQFDMFGSRYGSRGSLLNFESRTIGSGQLNRKCAVARIQELSGAVIRRLIQDNVGAILILLPSSPLEPGAADMPEDARSALQSLEQELWGDTIPVPVYFLVETPEFADVFEDMRRIDRASDYNSPLKLIVNSVLGNTYHLMARASQSKPLEGIEFVVMHGSLNPHGGLGLNSPAANANPAAGSSAASTVAATAPSASEGTIVISAYMDWFGSVPTLGRGYDSNGSGMLVLLRLARLLNYYYSMPGVRPRFSVLFLLSSGGKLSYYGTKRWIDENLESTDSALLGQVAMALCLESVGLKPAVNLHVSKLPKEGSLMHSFYERLRVHAEDPESVQLRQKKINLANEWLAWEHERFSIKRLPGLTLSQCPTPANCNHRLSVLDSQISWPQLDANYRAIAKALLDLLLNPSPNATDSAMMRHVYQDVDAQSSPVDAWNLSYGQLLSHGHRAYHSLQRSDPYVATLQSLLSPLLRDFRVSAFRPDRKEPEVVLYDAADSLLSVHVVKPALFDLFLACVIAAYLGAVFGLVAHFQAIVGLRLVPRLARWFLTAPAQKQVSAGKSVD